MPNGPSSASPRRPWMATAIWGWRLELSLSGGSFLLLAISARINAVGPYLVAAVVLLVLRMRPDIRRELLHHIGTNRDHRQLHAALWNCVIVID
jgi:hypothetical protein